MGSTAISLGRTSQSRRPRTIRILRRPAVALHMCRNWASARAYWRLYIAGGPASRNGDGAHHMVVEFYAGTGGFARRFSGKDAKFRPGIPGIAPGDLRAARLDYAAAYASVSEPCPTELDGIGHAEELEVTEVGAGEIAYGNVAWADGSLSETGYWEASRPVRSKNSGELAADLVKAKAAKVGAIKAKEATLTAAGFTYEIPESDDPHTYQIDYAAQQNMTSIGALFALAVHGSPTAHWRASWRISSAWPNSTTMHTSRNRSRARRCSCKTLAGRDINAAGLTAYTSGGTLKTVVPIHDGC
jgi:hypothetical protein